MNTMNLRETDYNKFNTIYYGEVLYNNDPTKQGRIKVSIPEIFGDEDASTLPWIYPIGYNSGVRLFNVPDEGTEVGVIFIGDVYTGFYGIGKYPQSESKIFNTDYPNVYGFEDIQGNYLTINKKTGDVLFHHRSGTEIKIDNVGNIFQKTEGSVYLDAATVHISNTLDTGSGYTGALQDGTGTVYSVLGGIIQNG